MAINIGPKIGIDGEAQFRKEINALVQQQKTLASEMKAVTSAFDQNDKSEKNLTAQTKILNQQIQVQQQRIEKLKEGLSAASKEFGEADSRTLKWKQAINDATTDLNKMKSQLSGLEKGVDDVGNSMDDAAKEAASFGDILKANVVGDFIVDGIKEIASQIKDIAVDFVEAAASVKAETSQFAQTFGEFGQQAKDAISTVADNAGILDTRLKTVGTQIFAFARASGGNATESLELMEKALQATADGAAYYDRSLEGTAESLQSFLKGNYENDSALGLSATETTRNAAAMEQFGKKFNDLTEIQKQQTLLQMVIDAQELSGAMGQAAREADGWENVQGNLNESWRQFMAAAGEPFLENLVPVVQEITRQIINLTNSIDWEAFREKVNGISNLIKDLFAFIFGDEDFPKSNIENFLNETNEKISDFFQNRLPSIFSFTDALSEKSGELLEVGIGFIQSIGNGMAQYLPTLIQNLLPQILSFVEGLREKAGELVDVGLQLIQNIWNGIMQALPDLIQYIPQIITNIAGIINDNFPKILATGLSMMWELLKGLIAAIPDIIAALPQIIEAIVSVFTAFNWISLGSNIITMLKNGITAMKGAIGETAKAIFETIKSIIANLPNTLKSIGSSAISFLSSGIRGMLSTVVGVAKNILAGIIDAIISLPSKLFDIGKNALSKLWEVFTGSDFKELGDMIIQGIIGGISAAWDGLVSWFNNLWNGLFGKKTVNVDVATTETRTVKTINESAKPTRPRNLSTYVSLPETAPMDISPLRAAYETIDSSLYQRVGTQLQQGYYRVQTAMGNAVDYTRERGIQATSSKSTVIDMGGINITVNPAPGMDENALAEKVSTVLENLFRQKEGLWA